MVGRLYSLDRRFSSASKKGPVTCWGCDARSALIVRAGYISRAAHLAHLTAPGGGRAGRAAMQRRAESWWVRPNCVFGLAQCQRELNAGGVLSDEREVTPRFPYGSPSMDARGAMARNPETKNFP